MCFSDLKQKKYKIHFVFVVANIINLIFNGWACRVSGHQESPNLKVTIRLKRQQTFEHALNRRKKISF